MYGKHNCLGFSFCVISCVITLCLCVFLDVCLIPPFVIFSPILYLKACYSSLQLLVYLKGNSSIFQPGLYLCSIIVSADSCDMAALAATQSFAASLLIKLTSTESAIF